MPPIVFGQKYPECFKFIHNQSIRAIDEEMTKTEGMLSETHSSHQWSICPCLFDASTLRKEWLLTTLATIDSVESLNWCVWRSSHWCSQAFVSPCSFAGDGGGVDIDLMYSICHLVPHCSKIIDRHDRERLTFNVYPSCQAIHFAPRGPRASRPLDTTLGPAIPDGVQELSHLICTLSYWGTLIT